MRLVPDRTPIMEAKRITKRIGGRELFRDLSIGMAAGEGLLVQGPSGCGKTMLLRCLGLLEPLDGGSISLSGTVVSEGGRRPRREGRGTTISMVFQHLYLWPHLSVWDNVTLAPGLRDRSGASWQAHVGTLMDRLGILERRAAFPIELSGGEQQRVAIARSLAQAPRVLLLDEITSGLDAEASARVYGAVADAKGTDVAVIVVSHRNDVPAALAERRLVFREGVGWKETGDAASVACPEP